MLILLYHIKIDKNSVLYSTFLLLKILISKWRDGARTGPGSSKWPLPLTRGPSVPRESENRFIHSFSSSCSFFFFICIGITQISGCSERRRRGLFSYAAPLRWRLCRGPAPALAFPLRQRTAVRLLEVRPWPRRRIPPHPDLKLLTMLTLLRHGPRRMMKGYAIRGSGLLPITRKSKLACSRPLFGTWYVRCSLKMYYSLNDCVFFFIW